MGTDAPQDPFAAADPFAAGAQTAEAPAPASAIDPPDEAPAAGDIPTVNADGHKINPETGEIIEYAEGYEPPNAETPVAPEARPATPEEAAAQPEAAPEPPAAEPPAPEAPADPQPENAAQEPPQPPVEPQGAATEAPAAPPETETAGDGAGEPPQPPDAPPATAEPSGGDSEAAAATPEEGKSPWRHYMLVYQTGPGQWTEADLANVPDELKQYVERKPLNDKKPDETALFLKARNADHARRLAWIIFGRPSSGVTVNAVARSSWQPKRLSPAPPQPERERLSIS